MWSLLALMEIMHACCSIRARPPSHISTKSIVVAGMVDGSRMERIGGAYGISRYRRRRTRSRRRLSLCVVANAVLRGRVARLLAILTSSGWNDHDEYVFFRRLWGG
jgi:hypothetical protein